MHAEKRRFLCAEPFFFSIVSRAPSGCMERANWSPRAALVISRLVNNPRNRMRQTPFLSNADLCRWPERRNSDGEGRGGQAAAPFSKGHSLTAAPSPTGKRRSTNENSHQGQAFIILRAGPHDRTRNNNVDAALPLPYPPPSLSRARGPPLAPPSRQPAGRSRFEISRWP